MGSEAIATFSSIQPPNEASEHLQEDLSELLNFAEDALSEARIARRRGDTETLVAAADMLQRVDEQMSNRTAAATSKGQLRRLGGRCRQSQASGELDLCSDVVDA